MAKPVAKTEKKIEELPIKKESKESLQNSENVKNKEKKYSTINNNVSLIFIYKNIFLNMLKLKCYIHFV